MPDFQVEVKVTLSIDQLVRYILRALLIAGCARTLM